MKLTELLLSRVVNERGKLLGHVIDVRCEPLPGKTRGSEPILTELLYGAGGLLERLGLREVKTEGIPWNAVLKFDGKTITVRQSATRRKGR